MQHNAQVGVCLPAHIVAELFTPGKRISSPYVHSPAIEHLDDDELWRADRTALRPVARGDSVNLFDITESPPRILADRHLSPAPMMRTLNRRAQGMEAENTGTSALKRLAGHLDRLLSPMSAAAAWTVTGVHVLETEQRGGSEQILT